MKKLLGFLSLAALTAGAVLVLRNPAEANPPQQLTRVLCNGSNSCCQGTGSRQFIYDVQLGGGATVSSIEVGTHDNNINDYVNLILPTNWTLQIVSGSPVHNSTCTPHGSLSTPESETPCSFVLRFSGPAQSTNFTLGYDFIPNWDHHDANWAASNGFAANWGRPVGRGIGPVHSPFIP